MNLCYLVLAGFHNTRPSPLRVRCDKINFIRLCSPVDVTQTIVEACKTDDQFICEVVKIDLDDKECLKDLAFIIHYGLIQQINVGEG